MTSPRRGGRRARHTDTRDERPSTCLIMTEGTETEVHYFENMRNIINTRFQQRAIQDNYPIKVEGTGRSTSVLVNEAIKKKSREGYSQVWVVFDKDDNVDFDDAIRLANNNGIKVAWSNESFELWLVLHFQYLRASLSIDAYIDILNKKFKDNKIYNGSYSKTIPNIFDITCDKIDNAISRSEKLREEYRENNIFSQSDMNPGTTVDILVKELLQYIR